MDQQWGNMPGTPTAGGALTPPMTPPTAPQAPAKQKNTLGLIALIVGLVGFVFACVPGALVVGWVLLPIAFVLGVVGLLQSGKTKGTSTAAVIVSIVGTVVGVVVFATVVGDAVSDAFSEPGLSAAPASPPAAGSRGGDTAGSRDNPLPIGEAVRNADWTITLGTPREAWAEIEAENQFNEPPPAGMQFWIVPVTATYTGDKTGHADFEVTVKFVGSDNRTYDDRCGVIPDSIDDVGELYQGGVAQGNRCLAVPAGADGLWTVSTGFTGKPVFFTAR